MFTNFILISISSGKIDHQMISFHWCRHSRGSNKSLIPFSSIFSSTFLFFDVETEIIFVEFRWKGEKLGCYFEMEIVQTIVWKVLLH